ncbi:MAG TPA: hypothetical protein PKA76_19370 [Pirellulaceae bacterium]|nr:hypothetical protein [Pirellulaceae bacterium]
MKTALFLIIALSIGGGVVLNQKGIDEVDKIRNELARLGAIADDEEFAFEFGKFLQFELGVQTPMRFGEWYPAAAGAQFQVLNDGSVLLRDKKDDRVSVSETGIFVVGDDGIWHQTPHGEHAIVASLTICKNVVVLVNIEKGTTSRVVRNTAN